MSSKSASNVLFIKDEKVLQLKDMLALKTSDKNRVAWN